jgi:hypothetical protein
MIRMDNTMMLLGDAKQEDVGEYRQGAVRLRRFRGLGKRTVPPEARREQVTALVV